MIPEFNFYPFLGVQCCTLILSISRGSCFVAVSFLIVERSSVRLVSLGMNCICGYLSIYISIYLQPVFCALFFVSPDCLSARGSVMKGREWRREWRGEVQWEQSIDSSSELAASFLSCLSARVHFWWSIVFLPEARSFFTSRSTVIACKHFFARDAVVMHSLAPPHWQSHLLFFAWGVRQQRERRPVRPIWA